jgi:glycosyltransferase involved in cell wall biosynthesis
MICPKDTLLRSNGSRCAGPESGRACREYCSELPVERIPQRLAKARDFLTQAKAVTALSPFLAQIFQREFGSLDIKLIRCGFLSNTAVAKTRRYSPGDPVVFCYAGSLDSYREVHSLVEAFKSVGSPMASLKIYTTKGASETYVRMLRDTTRQDSRIEFCGEYEPEQFGEIVLKIDVLVIPPLLHEKNLSVVNEALASQVPIIVSDVRGMAEMVEDGVNGFVFKSANANSLAKVVQKVVDTPEVLNTLRVNIGRMVFSTPEQEAYAYERIYNQVCVA